MTYAWSTIEQLFHEALARPAEERGRYLDRACGGDALLRREIDALLESDSRASGFLSTPVVVHAEGRSDSAACVSIPEEPTSRGATHRSEAERPFELAAGTVIGGYQIVRPLGRGGMGEVYEAEDLTLNRHVAIKLLTECADSAAARNRLLQEARAASSLNHPHIITIHSVGRDRGRDFLVMEYVEGSTLRQRLASSALEFDELLTMATQIADALAAAHARGIVHRDLKPDNVVLMASRQVKLLDFGIAARSQPETSRTEPPLIVGSLSYMSPEQAAGKPADFRSDQFSLGSILYEAAAGVRPFDRSTTRETLAAVLQADAVSLSERCPRMPDPLRSVIERCLARDPADRYASTEDLHRELTILRARRAERRRMRSWRTALVAGSIVLAAGVATRQTLWLPAASPPAHVRLAILPFENLTGNPDQEFFCDGLTEEMISKLGSLAPQRLSVVARGSVMHYKSRPEPLEAIGRELDVGYIVQGSVRRDRDRVRISTQLTDISRRTVVWVRNYDRDLTEVVSLQDEVALAVAREVGGQLALGVTGSARQTKPANFEAYEAYLRGRYFWNQRTAEGLRKAIEHFQEAVQLDPRYAAAYAGIAQAYAPLGFFGYVPPGEALAGMRAAVARALAIDHDLAEAHMARAALLAFKEWRLADAQPAFHRALALNSGDAQAHSWYAQYLIATGRLDEALAESRRAIALDPLNLNVNTNLGIRLYWARRFDEAIAQCRKPLELDPVYFAARTCLALAHAQQGAHEQAVRELESAGSGHLRTPSRLGDLGYIYARAGRSDDARAIIAELTNRASREYVQPYAVAVVHAGLGENGRAMDWLERAYDERSPRLLYINVEPMLDGLRAEPRFKRLVQRVAQAAR